MNDYAKAAEILKQQQGAVVDPFAAAAEKLKAQQAGQAGVALTYDTRNPDDAARAIDVGRQLGVNPLLVGADMDAHEKRLQMQMAAEILKAAPKTAAWVSDMGNGVLAKDDLENLTWFERTLNKTTGAITSGVTEFARSAESTQVGKGFQTGVTGMKQMGTAVATIPINQTAQFNVDLLAAYERVGGMDPSTPQAEIAKQLGIDPRSPVAVIVEDFIQGDEARRKKYVDQAVAGLTSNKELMSALVDQVNAYSLEMQKTSGRMPNFTDIEDVNDFTDWLSFNTGQMIPYMAAIMASGAIGGPVAMGGTGYALGVGDIQSNMIEQGITDRGDIALLGGAPYAALEYLGPAAKPFRGVSEKALTEVAKGYFTRLGRDIPQQVVEEFINEAGQEIIIDLSAAAAGGDEVVLNDETLLKWFNAGMAGAAGAFSVTPGSTYIDMRIAQDAAKAELAGSTAQKLAEVEAQAMVSKLRERAPEKFKALLDAQGGADIEVFVPADALREYFQAKDLSIETMQQWGIDPATFEEAAQSGNDVAIPMSNYATYIAGTDAAPWFAENATSNVDEMSIATAKAFNAAVRDIMDEAFIQQERVRQADEESRASDVQIYDQMFSQLRQAGRSPDVAQREAQVWSAFWRTMGERYGEDPLDLARSMGVRVQGPQSPEFRRRDHLDIALNTLRTQGAKALKPKGLSLAEFVKAKGGIQDTGGDVAAMEPPKGVVAETAKQIRERANQPTLAGVPLTGAGVSLEDMGRMAAEAGYFPDLMGEVNAGMNKGEATDFAARLLEALGEDVAGRKVYAEGEGPDANLKALSDALSERGIDLAAMSNDEIVAALEAADGQSYNQDGTLKTDTPEFAAWFGDSKVVDADGEPLVVYHGTRAEFDAFNAGISFFGSKELAEDYALEAYAEGEPRTLAVYLSIRNPATDSDVFRVAGVPDDGTTPVFEHVSEDVVSALQAEGFDGLHLSRDASPSVPGGPPQESWAVFSPTQIKSVYNRGTFDPNDPRILYQPAYHGSPHIFDKFSTDKIGTGEGAQAFGWGLYFAGRKGVADYYRDALTDRARTSPSKFDYFAADGSPIAWYDLPKEHQRAAAIIADAGGRENIEQINLVIEQGYRDDAQARIKSQVQDFLDSGITWKKPGRLYKVEIPEDSDLLVWDAQLTDQPDRIWDAVKEAYASIFPGGTYGPDERETGSDAYQRLSNAIKQKAYQDGVAAQSNLRKRGIDPISPEGQAETDGFRDRMDNPDRYASEALRDAGIPGHRYLDQGSRADGDGTYNYVIYDDAAVSVLEFEQDKRGSIVLPSGGLGSGQTVINLFESADLSTFLHESGHFFLEAFNALASEANAPQAMKDDMAAILDWFGVKDWSEVGVKQHEQWARGFEAYAMEGKAPSLALADAFSRFKAWLTRIYKTVRGLNVKITPEIRDVMDRMLATDEEIAAAREMQSMSPLFTTTPPGMSDTDFSTYQRMARRATESAEQRLLERTMAKVRREREAWYRAEKKAVTKEVASEFDRRPEYRLIDLLANQVWIGADDGAAIPDMQIDRKMLVEQFGEGVLPELSRNRLGGKRAIYGENGESPQGVAEFFGFAGAEEMIAIMQNTSRKRDAISVEVERRMTERYGDPLHDGSIEEEALAAIHNEQQAQTSVAEARHLATQLGRSTAGMTAKLYRQRARAMVGRMMVRDVIKPERFLASERKAARAAQDAFAKVARQSDKAENALAAALQAKEQQILNGFIYDEAKKVAAEIQKGREKMRSYDKASVREKLDGGYIEQIDGLLEAYDFRVRGQRQVARAESLKAFIDRMIEEGREAELNISEALADEANRKHYTRMSVDEIRGLFDTIENIDHLGRFKQKLIDRARQRDLMKSVDNVVQAIKTNLGTGKVGKQGKIAAAFNLLWRTDTLLVRMDGGEEMGVAYDEIKRAIDESVSIEQLKYMEMAKALDKLFSTHYTAAELRKMRVEKNIPGGNGRPWSKVDILAVAMNTGAEDNFARLTAEDAALPNRLTREHVDALLATMTEKDWRFVQDLWDMVNSYWPDLAAVHKRRTGVEPKKVEAKLMVNAPSFVTGGYYPIQYDPALSAAAATDEASGWDKFTATGRGATAAIRNGMTKQRQKSGGGRTLRLELSVAFSHMRDTIRYIALSEAVDNAYRLISRPEVTNAFLDAGAPDQHQILRLWLKDIASGPKRNTDVFNTVARIAKNNFTLSRLAFNMKTVALQLTGAGQSAAVIGKRNMILGYLEYMQNPWGTAAAVKAKSNFMAQRSNTFQKDIHDFMDETTMQGPLSSAYKKGKSTLAKAGFYPIVWTQFWGVDMPTWLGAFRAGIEKYGGDEAKAIHYADRMVARAQDSGMTSDRAAVERGTLGNGTVQSDVVRLFTTLGGYMLTKMNRAYVTAIQARKGWRDADTATAQVAAATGAATDLMVLYITEAVLTALIYSLMADGEDDDDIKKFLLRETGSAMVGGIPVVKDIYSSFTGFGGGGIYGSLTDAPVRLFTQMVQGENDKALRRSILDMVGMVTGLPTTGPMRAIEGAIDKDVPLSEAIFGRNPLNQ